MDPDEGLKAELDRLLREIREGHPPLAEHSLDADALASFFGHVFYEAGYKTRLKIVKQPGMTHFHHVFVEVWHPKAKEWIPVDPHRTPPAGWEEEAVVGV